MAGDDVSKEQQQEKDEQLAVEKLRKFLLSHPKIINPITETPFLKRFLHYRNMVVDGPEGAGQMIIDYIKARRDHPSFYQNLDIDNQPLHELIGRGYIFPLSQKTVDGQTVVMIRNEAFSFYKYGNLGTDSFRAMAMTFEHLLCDEDNQRNGSVSIVDFSGTCLSEIMKVRVHNLQVVFFIVLSQIGLYELQKYVRSGAKLYPINKNSSIHWINTSGGQWMRRSMDFMIPQKMSKMIHIHSEMSELFNFVPPHILPDEYGGHGGPMDDMVKEFIQQLRDNKPFLMSLDSMSYK